MAIYEPTETERLPGTPPFPLFHGTVVDLKPGQIVSPPEVAGVASNYPHLLRHHPTRSQYAFATMSIEEALFSAEVAARGAALGRARF